MPAAAPAAAPACWPARSCPRRRCGRPGSRRNERLHEVGTAPRRALAPAPRSRARSAAPLPPRAGSAAGRPVLRELGGHHLHGHGPPSRPRPRRRFHAPATDDPGDPVRTPRVARPGLERNFGHSSAASIVQHGSGNPNPTSTPCVPPPERGHWGSLWTGELSATIGSRDRGGRTHGRRVPAIDPQGARWPRARRRRAIDPIYPSASAARAGCSPR